MSLPTIVTTCDSDDDVHRDFLLKSLLKVLPKGFNSFDQFDSLLPLVEMIEVSPKQKAFFLIKKSHTSLPNFFSNMITSWLVPGKFLSPKLVYKIEFKLPKVNETSYVLHQLVLKIENQDDLEIMKKNFPIISAQIRLGSSSIYFARKVLESKGLAADEKAVLIWEHIARLTKKLPKLFESDLFSEMQHVLMMSRDEFKANRSSTTLSRIISIQYLFRKTLKEEAKNAPEKRHLSLKLIKLQNSLGIVVGVNFLQDKEVFEERHLVKAVQHYIPDVQPVKGSFFASRRGAENICTLYLEVQKSNAEPFTGEEIQKLRIVLPGDLKDRIEYLVHPIFMPRNEEEIMRNILSLSNQIKFVRDIPQVFITFDEQNYNELSFLVILVRVLKPESLTVSALFKNCPSLIGCIHDRSKIVGHLRNKYAKEANVFRFKLAKEPFLRGDHSIDLNKARQVVVSELVQVLGDIRDYNGGMISKQNELLCSLRELLADVGKYNDLLLENFFYSLTPVVMRSVLDPAILKNMFILFLDLVEEQFSKDYMIKTERELDLVYMVIRFKEPGVKDELTKMLNRLNLASTELVTAFVNTHDTACLGYLYRSDDPYNQDHFCQTIENGLESLYAPYS